MADFPKYSSAALLRIVHPVIARDETSVDAVMQRHRFLDLFEKRLHLYCHRSESPIETKHQQAIAPRDGISSNNLCQADFAQAKRFLTKDVLAGRKRSQHLGHMQMITSGDHNRVHV